jgi:hypothetical protein
MSAGEDGRSGPVASANMDSTWDVRDFRVLEAIIQIAEDKGRNSVTAAQIASDTGLDDKTIQAALRALGTEDPPFSRLKVPGAERFCELPTLPGMPDGRLEHGPQRRAWPISSSSS